MADEKAKPKQPDEQPAEKTGRNVLAYLRETGTGTERCQKVEEHLARYPKATAAELVAYMESSGFHQGTVEKAGRFVYGPAYAYAAPGQGRVTHDQELANLRAQNAQLRQTLKDMEAKNHGLVKTIAQLRQKPDLRADVDDEQRLPDERPAGKRALAGAGVR